MTINKRKFRLIEFSFYAEKVLTHFSTLDINNSYFKQSNLKLTIRKKNFLIQYYIKCVESFYSLKAL